MVSMEGGGSGMPDATGEPFGGVLGLIQRHIDEGRSPLANPKEMLRKASLLLLSLLSLLG